MRFSFVQTAKYSRVDGQTYAHAQTHTHSLHTNARRTPDTRAHVHDSQRYQRYHVTGVFPCPHSIEKRLPISNTIYICSICRGWPCLYAVQWYEDELPKTMRLEYLYNEE